MLVAQVSDNGFSVTRLRMIVCLPSALSIRQFGCSVARLGLPDGVYLRCERQRRGVVFPCGWSGQEMAVG